MTNQEHGKIVTNEEFLTRSVRGLMKQGGLPEHEAYIALLSAVVDVGRDNGLTDAQIRALVRLRLRTREAR